MLLSPMKKKYLVYLQENKDFKLHFLYQEYMHQKLE